MTALWRCVKYDPLLKHLFVRKQQNGCGKNLSNLKNYKRTMCSSYHRNFKTIIQEKCAKYNTHWEEAVLAIATFEESWVVSFRTFKWLGWVCFGVVGSWCWLGLFQLLLWLVPSSVPCGAGSGARGFIMVCSWSSVFFLFFFFLCGHKGPPAGKMPWGWSSVSFFQCEELYFACCMIIMFVDYLFAYGDELITSIYFQKQEAHALEKASYLKCH